MSDIYSKMNPGERIFEQYFSVRFNYQDSLSAEEIRHRGLRCSGFSDIDTHARKEMVTSQLTINAMFEMWRKGNTVRVINYDDTKTIHDIIQAHLAKILDCIKNEVNLPNFDLEELIELDKFAGVVYEHAKYVFTNEVQKSFNEFFRGKNSQEMTNLQDIFTNVAVTYEVPDTSKIKTGGLNDMMLDGGEPIQVARPRYSSRKTLLKSPDTAKERSVFGDLFIEVMKGM